MQEQIVKWLNKNADNVQKAAVIIIVINLMIIGFSILAGNILGVFLSIPKILVADLMFFIPMVYIIKWVKELQ